MKATHPAVPSTARLKRQVLVVGLSLIPLACLGYYFRFELRGYVESSLTLLREAGPWPFFVAMAVLPAFGFPLLPFALAAGPAFNPSLGSGRVTVFAILAVATNVTLSYWFSRQLIGPWIHRLLVRLGYALPDIPSGAVWQSVFIVRLAPGLPFWVQSYLLGLLGIPLLPYLVVSTLIPSLYLTGTILFGGAAWEGHTREALIGAGILGFAACAISLWRRRKQGPRSP